MATPTFRLLKPGDALLVLDGAPSGTARVAFLPGGWPAAAPPAELSVEASWSDPRGVYLFLPATAWTADLASAVRTHLRLTPRARLLWIANPADPPFRWRTQLLEVAAGLTADAALFSLGDATLTVGAGCPVAPRLDGGRCELVISRAAAQTRSFALTSGAGLSRARRFGGAVTVPLAGPRAGCLTFELAVDAGEVEGLDAGIQYFYDRPDAADLDGVTSLRYPLFDLQGAVSLALQGCLDPNAPLDGARTFLAVRSEAPLPSHFRTHLGQPVTLTPAATPDAPDGPRLVFSPRPLHTVPGPADPLYLTPQGAFTIGALGGRMLCGISGVEYAGLPAGGGRVHFFPGQPAHVPALSGDGKGAPPLAGPATTSWGYFTAAAGGEAIRYYSQPDEALLFEAGAETAAEILDFLEVPAAALRPWSAAESFPLVPYGGLDGRAAPVARRLEKEVLTPLRRRLVDDLAVPQGAPASVEPAPGDRVGTTPQGLLARFGEDGAWKTLTLARTGDRQARWHALAGPLKSALQRSETFLVISDPAQLVSFTEGDPQALTIAGWTFRLSPEDWAANGTILILKFQEGTLQELVEDPARWTSADQLNKDVAGTRSRLKAMIAEAIQRSAAEPAYAPFARIATGPWNGVLFLRARVPLTDLPEQLQGLAAGIDASRFFAHHLGLNVTPVEGEEDGLRTGDSSLFGLISYDDPEHQFAPGEPYAFKVLSLQVRFQNSAIAQFSSRIELMVNRLFDEPANLPNGEAGNNLIFDGVYQKQGEQESYVFLQKGANLFRVTSNVIESVETARGQFLTVIPPGGLKPGERVRARFLLWGDLRLLALPAVDLFSFGPLRDATGSQVQDGRLSFSHLAVEMSFDPADPTKKTFTFDATALVFDLTRSAARPASFFRRFPLQLSGLVQPAAGTRAADLGYIPVTSPLGAGSLGDAWYGLTFTLDLGTLGALSGGASFTVTLLAAWSPGDGTARPRVFLGLQIPGTSGGKPQIPIEGVLKLAWKRTELTVVPGENGRPGSYLLRFSKIALSLFGFAFPPGRTDLLLFGNPEGGDDKSVGWYAAYTKDFVRPLPPGGGALG